MSRHQRNCQCGIAILQAAVIFTAGIATAAVAVVGFWEHADNIVLFIGGVPTIFLFAIGFRLCSAAFRVDDDYDEEETLQGIPNHALEWNQQRGDIQLPTAAIARLEQLQSAQTDGVDTGGDGAECVVCLGKLRDGELATRQLPACRHVFHKHCIEQWLRAHPTCPICRCNARQESLEIILRLNT